MKGSVMKIVFEPERTLQGGLYQHRVKQETIWTSLTGWNIIGLLGWINFIQLLDVADAL